MEASTEESRVNEHLILSLALAAPIVAWLGYLIGRATRDLVAMERSMVLLHDHHRRAMHRSEASLVLLQKSITESRERLDRSIGSSQGESRRSQS
jgi:hypothetical protein